GLLATGSRDGGLHLWHCDGDEPRELFHLHLHNTVQWLAFHPDGVRLFALIKHDRAVRAWHLDRFRARMAEVGLDDGLEVIKAKPVPVVPPPPAHSEVCEMKRINHRPCVRRLSLPFLGKWEFWGKIAGDAGI